VTFSAPANEVELRNSLQQSQNLLESLASNSNINQAGLKEASSHLPQKEDAQIEGDTSQPSKLRKKMKLGAPVFGQAEKQ